MYAWSKVVMQECGVLFPATKEVTYKGIKILNIPRIILTPRMGVTQEEVKKKISAGDKLKIDEHSTLLLDGENIFL